MAGFSPSKGYGSGRLYTSRAHYDAARGSRGDAMSGGASIHIDTREIQKLERALREAGAGYKKSQTILAQSLNRAGKRVATELKRAIQRWTGIKRQVEITKRMTPVVATAGMMRAGVVVSGRHFRITKADFGAKWTRAMPGVAHSAWGRSQVAKGAFMAFRGGSSYGGGLAFKRTSAKRLPIKPLWGPHAVREMQRRSAFCRAIVTKEARWFARETLRRAEVELRKTKAKYGL
jgi:hypothetical protein